MKTKPGPGDVLLWQGSHDVVGTSGPVVLVEPTTDPGFWLVATLDEQGLPTPHRFAVPVDDLVPVAVLATENSVRATLLRVAVTFAAAASFALGAVSLIGQQPETLVAGGVSSAPSTQDANAPSVDNPPWELSDQPSGFFQPGSSLVSVAALGSLSGTGAPTLTLPNPGGKEGSGLPSSGGMDGAKTGGGGSGGGSGGGGSVAAPDTHPGNSGSAPGHNSTPGNSGSSNGNGGSGGGGGSHGNGSSNGNGGSGGGGNGSSNGNGGSGGGGGSHGNSGSHRRN